MNSFGLQNRDVKFVAELLGIGQHAIYQSLRGQGKIPLPRVTRIGKLIRFQDRHIEEFLDHRAGVAAPALQAGCEAPAVTPSRNSGKPGRPRKLGITVAAGAK
jgi:predicted DNA-binding transcriptional regulator AlpA